MIVAASTNGQPAEAGGNSERDAMGRLVRQLGPDCTWDQAELAAQRQGIAMTKSQFFNARLRLRKNEQDKRLGPPRQPRQPKPKPQPLPPPSAAAAGGQVPIAALGTFLAAVKALGGPAVARQVLECFDHAQA